MLMTLYVNGIQRVELLKIHKTEAFLYLRDVFFCCCYSFCSWFFDSIFLQNFFNLAVTLLHVKVAPVVVSIWRPTATTILRLNHDAFFFNIYYTNTRTRRAHNTYTKSERPLKFTHFFHARLAAPTLYEIIFILFVFYFIFMIRT